MRHILGLEVPNILPETFGLRAAGRLIWTSLLFVVLLAPIFVAVRRPKPARKATWAQAMGGAVLVFALMILAYGSIPHEWLTFANKYLKWDESHFVVTAGQDLPGPFVWLNFDVDKRTLNDTGASIIYLVMLGLNVYLFSAWQKRPAAKPDDAVTAEAKVVGTSAFGRPVTAKA
jgi:hypothetical protein